MRRLTSYSFPVLAAVAVGSLTMSAAMGGVRSPASGDGGKAGTARSSVKWTKISADTGLGIASAGLWRTADGRLHVVWPSHDGTTFSLHYSTVGGRAKLLATGAVFRHWGAVSAFPRLIAGPHRGMRLVFNGANGQSGSPYNSGAMFIAAGNAAGTKWTLLNGSLSHSEFLPLGGATAGAEGNGTPVAAWSTNTALTYHVGVDPNIPAKTPDRTLSLGPRGGVEEPTLIQGKDGSVSAAFYNASGDASQAYYVARLAPSTSAKVRAPDSHGGKNLDVNQPLEPAAFAARIGGGEYLAYCVPTKVTACVRIVLWRVGAKKAMTVPGSGSSQNNAVAIAAGRGGHMWVLWFDYQFNRLHVIRTNAAVTGFGRPVTLPLPPRFFDFQEVQGQGSAGPLDVIALLTQNLPNSSPAYWDTQILPALRIRASKSSVNNGHTTTVTFTVLDAGDGVAGAAVHFLGKTGKTSAKGTVKFTIRKGTSKGKHTATASKAGYAPASFTVKVT
jgi:hypothetical protein